MNSNNTDELREVFYPDNFVKMSTQDYDDLKMALNFDLSSIDYIGDKWEISDISVEESDKNAIEKELNKKFGTSVKLKKSYKVTADIRVCNKKWSNFEFNVFKTPKNLWAVSEDFFEFSFSS